MNVNATVNDIINPHRSLGAARRTAAGPAQAFPPPASKTDQTNATRGARPTAPTFVAKEIPLKDITVPAPASDPSGAQGHQGGLTVEGLKAAWGDAESMYDLNADGTVNFTDMLKLLGMLGESGGTSIPIEPIRPAPAPNLTPADPDITAGPLDPTDPDAPASVALGDVAPDTGTATNPPAEVQPITLESLMEAWGQQGTRFDLNGDGTVNFGDVLQLLAQLNGREQVAPPEVPGTPGVPDLDAAQPVLAADAPDEAPIAGTPNLTDAAPETGNENPITIDELLAAWGKRDERLDINADGTVNFGDILELLAQQGNRSDATPNAATAGAGDIDPATLAQRVQPIAESLLEQLEARGFDQHPPLNIHQVVAQFGLGGDEQQSLLDTLARRYPEGLGVNLRA